MGVLKFLLWKLTKRFSSQLDELRNMCEDDVELRGLWHTKPVPKILERLLKSTNDSLIVGVQSEAEGGVDGVPKSY